MKDIKFNVSRLEVMAYYTKEKIAKTEQEEIIVSNQMEKFIAADGSTCLVPVVNIAVLQLIQELYSNENNCMNAAFLDGSDVDQMDTNEVQCRPDQTLDIEPKKKKFKISV